MQSVSCIIGTLFNYHVIVTTQRIINYLLNVTIFLGECGCRLFYIFAEFKFTNCYRGVIGVFGMPQGFVENMLFIENVCLFLCTILMKSNCTFLLLIIAIINMFNNFNFISFQICFSSLTKYAYRMFSNWNAMLLFIVVDIANISKQFFIKLNFHQPDICGTSFETWIW